jgi:hypothetical protein
MMSLNDIKSIPIVAHAIRTLIDYKSLLQSPVTHIACVRIFQRTPLCTFAQDRHKAAFRAIAALDQSNHNRSASIIRGEAEHTSPCCKWFKTTCEQCICKVTILEDPTGCCVASISTGARKRPGNWVKQEDSHLHNRTVLLVWSLWAWSALAMLSPACIPLWGPQWLAFVCRLHRPKPVPQPCVEALRPQQLLILGSHQEWGICNENFLNNLFLQCWFTKDECLGLANEQSLGVCFVFSC